MKAKEIRKTLLHNYENEIKEYMETKRGRETRLKIQEALIRQLEIQLTVCFNINKKFNTETGQVEKVEDRVPF